MAQKGGPDPLPPPLDPPLGILLILVLILMILSPKRCRDDSVAAADVGAFSADVGGNVGAAA